MDCFFRIKYSVTVLLVGFVIILLFCIAKGEGFNNPVVIKIYTLQGDPVYQIESKRFKHGELDKLYDYLRIKKSAIHKLGPIECVVIVDDKTRIKTIYNIQGLLQKFGSYIKFYVGNEDRGWMREFKFCKGMKFSTTNFENNSSCCPDGDSSK